MKRFEKVFPWGLLVAFLGVVFVLNVCYSFSSDDCVYGLAWQGVEGSIRPRLSGWSTVWAENVADGYRPVVHLFARLFTGWLGKGAFNVANTAMLGLLLLLLNRLATGGWKLSMARTPLLIALVLFILCKGESYLWCAGSVNYLWAGTATLAFCLMRESVEQSPRLGFLLLPMAMAALFCGWAQEGFALPMCFALGLWSLAHWRELRLPKVFVLGCYGLGAVFLCLVAGRRASSIEPFSLVGVVITQLKIWVAVKGVWGVLLCLAFSSDRIAFLRRNGFELFVIAGSLLLISVVGFNGERSLWCANLFAVLIVLREVIPPRWVSVGLTVALIPLCAVLVVLGIRIRSNFDTFLNLFLTSPEGITCHERVACGPFARFFHQAIYTWQTKDGHGQAFAEYHGRLRAPIALSRELYEALYLKDTFCRSANRLPLEGRFYTTSSANAIVMPLPDEEVETDWEKVTVHVTYEPAKNPWQWLQMELATRRNPPVANKEHPVKLLTSHGSYLLIAKRPGCDAVISDIRFKGFSPIRP